jgi:hypothetical protein
MNVRADTERITDPEWKSASDPKRIQMPLLAGSGQCHGRKAAGHRADMSTRPRRRATDTWPAK